MQQNNKLKSQREDANNFNGDKGERGRIKKEKCLIANWTFILPTFYVNDKIKRNKIELY